MISTTSTLLAISMAAMIVYLTRIIGYLLGQKLRHIEGLRSVLETLPGCAMMAILVPAVRQGEWMDFISLAVVLGLMWKTDNVVIATVCGMTVLVAGEQIFEYVMAVS